MKNNTPRDLDNDLSTVFINRKIPRWPIMTAMICLATWLFISGDNLMGVFAFLWLMIGLVAWLINQRGHPELSSHVVLLSSWVLVSSFALQWPLLRQAIPVVYIILFFAALQLNNRTSVFVFIISVISQFSYALLEHIGCIATDLKYSDPTIIALLYTTLLSFGFVYLFSSKITASDNVQEVGNLAQRFQALFNNANDAVIFIDFDFLVMEINQKAADLLGLSPEELIGKSLRRIAVTDDFRRDVRLFQALAAGKQIPLLERQARGKDGALIDVELNAVLVKDTDGNPLYIQCVVRDITEKNHILNDLMEYQQRYQALFNRTGETIFITAFDLSILSANPQAYKLLAYQPPELKGKIFTELLSGEEDLEKMYHTRDALQKGDTIPNQELNMQRKDGVEITVDISSATVYNGLGKPIYMQHFARDITSQRVTEARLKTSLNEMVVLAATDTLTGINNRRTIEEYAENLLQRAEAKRLPFSVALIDMDNLKTINDKYGHMVGDQALRHLANLAEVNKRITDMLGRWAGDEFLLLLPDTSRKYAYNMALRIHEMINNSPLKLPGNENLILGTSIGVTGIEPDDLSPYQVERLIQQADMAMYQAKSAGRNQVKLFQDN